MKILFIAPLPPPITGHSLVSKVLFDYIVQKDEVFIVNLSKDSLKEGVGGIKRIKQVINIFFQIYKGKKNADAIYLTISESLAGNLKDVLIYLICFNKLNKFHIHLHGGSIKKLLWEKNNLIFKINKFFIKRLGGVIVSGKSHLEIFNNLISESRIKIIPNFAQESLFISESDFQSKFNIIDPIKLLYVGGLIEMKGYFELTKAFIELPKDVKRHFVLDIAGKFESETAESNFFKLVDKNDGIIYHGIIDDATKKQLFSSAHIFCLPTSFLEGQPISILEAYASGCLVLTTPQSGILDIFENNINGFIISERNVEDVKNALIYAYTRISDIKQIANCNKNFAYNNYKLEKYVTAVRDSFENQNIKNNE
jgi:glycosyltransferase involved in cell wall biosynthesis